MRKSWEQESLAAKLCVCVCVCRDRAGREAEILLLEMALSLKFHPQPISAPFSRVLALDLGYGSFLRGP